MAEGDQLGSLLCAHDAGDLGHGEHVALLHQPFADEAGGFGLD